MPETCLHRGRQWGARWRGRMQGTREGTGMLGWMQAVWSY